MKQQNNQTHLFDPCPYVALTWNKVPADSIRNFPFTPICNSAWSSLVLFTQNYV